MADFEDDIDGQGAAGGTRPASGPGSAERHVFDAEVERDIHRAYVALPPLAPPLAGGLRHIDAYPGMNNVNPIHPHPLTLEGLRNFIDGITIPDFGPHITFINDEPKNPSPDQPVTDATARMVERAVVDSGVRSVNINSTTGGKHDPGGNHPPGRAVDINGISGFKVVNRLDLAGGLQSAFARQPEIRENYGPASQTEVSSPGQSPSPVRKVREGHKNHDHFSAQR